MSDFCRHHGFYAPCPSCTGEEVIWEIPIVDCLGLGGIDVFRLNAGVYEDAMSGAERPQGDQPLPYASGDHSAPIPSSQMPPARDHIPLRVNQPLYARVRMLLETPVAPV